MKPVEHPGEAAHVLYILVLLERHVPGQLGHGEAELLDVFGLRGDLHELRGEVDDVADFRLDL